MSDFNGYGVHPVNSNENDRPNHFIIWLDKHIGKPDECVLLKSSVFMAMDPTTSLFERKLNQDDINQSIAYENAILVQLDQVQFMFQAFVDIEKCFLTIQNNLDKRIFLITSGSKGRILVPGLIANFEDTFGRHNRIYIFCANILMEAVDGVDPPSNTWTMDFLDKILVFNHQDDLFSRMVLDIAEYFSNKGQHFDVKQELRNARDYYQWARRMYERYEKLERKRKTVEILAINERINEIEQRLDPYINHGNDDDDDPIGTEDA